MAIGRKAGSLTAIGLLSLIAAVILVFVVPDLLRLGGPLVCPSDYDHSEGYHFSQVTGSGKEEETRFLPSLRCIGSGGEIVAERASGEPGVVIVALGLAALSIGGLELRARRKAR